MLFCFVRSGKNHRAVLSGHLSSFPHVLQPCAAGPGSHGGGAVATAGEGEHTWSVHVSFIRGWVWLNHSVPLFPSVRTEWTTLTPSYSAQKFNASVTWNNIAMVNMINSDFCLVSHVFSLLYTNVRGPSQASRWFTAGWRTWRCWKPPSLGSRASSGTASPRCQRPRTGASAPLCTPGGATATFQTSTLMPHGKWCSGCSASTHPGSQSSNGCKVKVWRTIECWDVEKRDHVMSDIILRHADEAWKWFGGDKWNTAITMSLPGQEMCSRDDYGAVLWPLRSRGVLAVCAEDSLWVAGPGAGQDPRGKRRLWSAPWTFNIEPKAFQCELLSTPSLYLFIHYQCYTCKSVFLVLIPVIFLDVTGFFCTF